MSFVIRRADYYYATVEDQPADAYALLSTLAGLGVNLLAFGGLPVGPTRTQLTLFPADPAAFEATAKRSQLELDGPHGALLVQGDDELGALAKVHEKLAAAEVRVFASSGVSDGHGRYGYVIYVAPEALTRASEALGV